MAVVKALIILSSSWNTKGVLDASTSNISLHSTRKRTATWTKEILFQEYGALRCWASPALIMNATPIYLQTHSVADKVIQQNSIQT